MLKLKLNNGDAVIESDFCGTVPFKLGFPVLIERTGMTEGGKGVYVLSYILEEKERRG